MRERITFTEFIGWLEYIRREEEKVQKQDFYLAQIACQVTRGTAKNPRSVRIKDFLVRFSNPSADQKAKMAQSKAFWRTVVGFEQAVPVHMKAQNIPIPERKIRTAKRALRTK